MKKLKKNSKSKEKYEVGKCKVCKTSITNKTYNVSYGSNFCSWSCYEFYGKYNKKPNCECVVCGKHMYLKPYRLKKALHGVTCSFECKNIQKSKTMSNKNNHQYGLKGDKNGSFKGVDNINQYGYNMKYLPNHPKANKQGRYREHRYIIETEGDYDDNFFDIINGIKILKDDYHVHHIDKNRLNNNINNLIVLTHSEHMKLHNKEKIIIRDKTNGRIIGVKYIASS